MSGSTELNRLRFWKQLYDRGRGRGFLAGEQVLPEGPYLMPKDARIKPGHLFAYLAWVNRPETAVSCIFSWSETQPSVFSTLFVRRKSKLIEHLKKNLAGNGWTTRKLQESDMFFSTAALTMSQNGR